MMANRRFIKLIKGFQVLSIALKYVCLSLAEVGRGYLCGLKQCYQVVETQVRLGRLPPGVHHGDRMENGENLGLPPPDFYQYLKPAVFLALDGTCCYQSRGCNAFHTMAILELFGLHSKPTWLTDTEGSQVVSLFPVWNYRAKSTRIICGFPSPYPTGMHLVDLATPGGHNHTLSITIERNFFS